jgi:hypothetical protein
VLKALAGGNKQQGYILKEDAISPTVSNETVMLMCVIDADENRDVAIVDIPNAFVQTVVKDEKDRAFIQIRGPLFDILASIVPDVYGSYVMIGKKGKKQLLVQCLTALYGTMVASLLYYKKFVKSLRSKQFRLNPYDPCVVNKQGRWGAIDHVFPHGRLQDITYESKGHERYNRLAQVGT